MKTSLWINASRAMAARTAARTANYSETRTFPAQLNVRNSGSSTSWTMSGARTLSTTAQARAPTTIKTTADYEVIPFSLPEGFNVRSPQLAEREMVKLKLKNGMSGLVVSDPKTPFSSAAVTVDRGSWSDGEHQGTAHFLEHMLFLGTKKYPQENEYERYLQDYNGRFNAFTASDHTHYYFTSVFPKAFEGAMDRFTRFFYEPLFNGSCVDREMNAVEQEYRRNIILDGWRLIHVLKAISNKDHPFSQFNTGNLETMKKIDQQYLKQWYQNNYSSNIMSFCIVGAEPLDKMVDLANKNFSKINNMKLPEIGSLGNIFPDSTKGKLFAVESVKDTRELMLMWEIPFKFNDNITRPTDLLARILSQATNGSLLSVLKEKGLVTSMRAYRQHLGSENLLYQISLSLTEEGESKWREVCDYVYGSLNKFKTELVPKHVFDEIYALDKIDYQFQERYMDMASTCCELIHEEGIESFPRNSALIQEFNPVEIQNLAKELTAENSITVLLGKKPEFKCDQTEKWMQVKYGSVELESELIKRWDSQPFFNQEITKSIQFPEPNVFIPKDLQIVPKEPEFLDAKTSVPLLIKNENGNQLYFYQDNEFLVPKTAIKFGIRTPAVRPNDAKSLVLTNLFCRFVNDSLTDMVHKASMGGLGMSIGGYEGCGVAISIEGYSENAVMLFNTAINRLFEVDTYFKDEKLKIFKDTYIRQHLNALKNPPYQQAIETMKDVLFPEMLSHEELASTCKSVTMDDLRNFSKKLFDQYLIQGFVGGNITRESAIKCWDSVNELFKNKKVTTYQETKPHAIKLPEIKKESKNELLVKKNLEVPGNSTIVSVYLGPKSHHSWVQQNVLSTLLGEPFYSELRTKQQTGYIVSGYGNEQDRNYFLNMLVQSDTFSSQELQERINKFADEFIQKELVENKESEQRFDSVKQSLLDRLQNIHDSVESKLNFLSDISFDKTFVEGKTSQDTPDFKRIDKYVEELEKYTFEDAKEFAASVLSPKVIPSAGETLKPGSRITIHAIGAPKAKL